MNKDNDETVTVQQIDDSCITTPSIYDDLFAAQKEKQDKLMEELGRYYGERTKRNAK